MDIALMSLFFNVVKYFMSWWRSLLYRNQSTDMQNKSMDSFLYNRDLPHGKVFAGLDIVFA